MKALAICVWSVCLAVTLGEHLVDRLHHYETLHHSQLRHGIVKRSIRDDSYHQKSLSFTTLGKNFELRLVPRRGLFTNNVRAVVMDGNRNQHDVDIDKNSFYQGYVLGESGKNKVLAHWSGDVLMAKIMLGNETYNIEPSWRHLPQSDDYSLLTYRASDLKKNFTEKEQEQGPTSYCGFVHADHDDAAYTGKPANHLINPGPVSDGSAKYKREANEGTHHRQKRATTPTNSRCTVALVADYLFFAEVGGSDEVNTINYLIEEMSVVDDIYQDQNFNDEYIGLGFEIQLVIVHTAMDTYNAADITYNMDIGGDWGTQDLLTAFSKEDWGDVCLAHLWTAIAFSDGVLGLGWIASSAVGSAGGICSGNTGGYYYNTAWSTAINKYGSRILTQEAEIVTAHEYGHNWGSEHDPSTTECAPGGSDGDYIMYTYSVSGYEDNNWIFSPCSQRSIAGVLNNKMSGCFSEPSESYCGNFLVEGNEECDAGPSGLTDSDPCCDSTCMLKSGAVCSDENSACCSSCAFASSSVLCLDVGDSNSTCNADTYFFTGTQADCPNTSYRPDGSTCVDNGECQSGECIAFCEWNGLISCICDNDAHVCVFCCKATAGDNCTAFGWPGSTIDLPDGKTCPSGLCNSGVCDVAFQMADTRLWDIIETLDVNAIWEFIKKNIVLSIVVISLIVYIPICIIICIVDWRMQKQEKEELDWHNCENEKLYMENDAHRIRRTYTKQRSATNANNNSSLYPSLRQTSAASASRVHITHNTISPM